MEIGEKRENRGATGENGEGGRGREKREDGRRAGGEDGEAKGDEETRRDETREERERRERARHRTVVLTKERAQGEKGKETLKTLEVECRGYGVRGGTDAEHLPERSGESGNGWNGERRGAIHAMLSREQDSAGQ